MHPDFASLSRFALRESSSAEAAEIDAHLPNCADCRKEAREIALMEIGLERAAAETEGVGPCPDAVEWSAFLEGHGDAAEDAMLQQHLLSCDDCLHRVLMVHRARDGQVPNRALDEARRLGSRPRRVERPAHWLMVPLGVPRWAALGVSLSAILLAALFLRSSLAPSPATSVVQGPGTAPNQQLVWEELARLKPEHGRVTLLAVTPRLEQSMAAYAKKPGAAQKNQLLEQLQKLDPSLPTQHIDAIQMSPTSPSRPPAWVAVQWSDSQLQLVLIQASEKPEQKK